MAWKRWQIIVSVALLLCATAASALSLGRVRGTPLLGRGLDLAVQLNLEAQELAPEANCLSAEIFYGDLRVSPSLINVGVERQPSGEWRVRVRSSGIVDEPVVTLYLRSTCAASISRRYVLLAETLSDADAGAAPSLPMVIAPVLPSAAASATPPIAATAAGRVPQALQANPAQGGSANAASQSSSASNNAARAERRQAAREARQLARRPAPAQIEGSNDAPAAAPRSSLMRKSASQAKASTPRLQLDLLDLSSAELNLRGSAELSSAPSGDENLRRQAQALWRSLNATPEDAMRDTLRLETLETQMRSAMEQSKRQSQDIATLSADLQAAQRARYLNPFTIFVALLALAGVILSVVLWRRSVSSDQPWWGNAKEQEAQDELHLWEHLADGAAPPVPPVPPDAKSERANAGAALRTSSPSATKAKAPSAALEGLDALNTSPGVLAQKGSQGPLRFVEKANAPIDFKPASDMQSRETAKIKSLGQSLGAGRGGSMGRVDSTPPPSLMPPPSAGRGSTAKSASSKSGVRASRSFAHSDFGGSGFSSSRLITTEDLFDIQEQADFFMSLGQPEQAIEVLRNHISDKVETSALAYMDLFDIYHQTGREQDYEQLREEFNRVFNAHVPIFSGYGAQSNGLEDYPTVLENIQAVWHEHEAQQVIEEFIFRQPEQDQSLMDMTAYRELMTLYTLAKELAQPSSGYSMLPASSSKPIAPHAAQRKAADTASAQLPDIELGNGILLSGPQADMLSFEDPTIDMTPGLAEQNQALDFDLSQIDELGSLKRSKNAHQN